MSRISVIAEIFEKIYPGLFNITKNGSIIENITFDEEDPRGYLLSMVSSRHRMIFYCYYPEVCSDHKNLCEKLTLEQVIDMIVNDPEYDYIPNGYYDNLPNPKEFVFKKLLEEDFTFLYGTTRDELPTFKHTRIATYETSEINGINFEYYLREGVVTLKQIAPYIRILDAKLIAEVINEQTTIPKGVANYITPEIISLIRVDYRKPIVNEYLHNRCNISEPIYLEYCDIERKYASFNNCVLGKELSEKLLPLMPNWSSHTKRVNAMRFLTERYMDDNIFNELVTAKRGSYDEIIHEIAAEHADYRDRLLEVFPSKTTFMMTYMLKRGMFPDYNAFEEKLEKYYPVMKEYAVGIFSLGFCVVEKLHCEPSYLIYPPPSGKIDGKTIADVWRDAVGTEPPMEMVSTRYYTWMMDNKGKKRSPEHSALYTFFSEDFLENKIIFTRFDDRLTGPAEIRLYIPVDFEKLKTYLREELDTNDICTLTRLSARDWNELGFDKDNHPSTVVFNNYTNDGQHKLQMSELLNYLIENIEIEFGIACK